MRAYTLDRFGNLDALTCRDVPAPAAPGQGQVRVRIRAVSLNYRDLLVIRGHYGSSAKPGLIPVSDAAGEIAEIGQGVWRCREGDRVALTFNPDWMGGEWTPTPGGSGRGAAIPGVLCEQVTIGQDEIVALPDHLSSEEGATLPCAALTAWSSLCAGVSPLPGETLLVQGTGGVSTFALQFAKLFGMRVIALSSTEERLERLRSIGADDLINYRTCPAWDEQVLALTGGRGVDRIVEVGGAETLPMSLRCVRHFGRISLVGLLTGAPGSATPLNVRSANLHAIRVGSREDFIRMNRAIEWHRLRPVVDRVFGFSDASQAFARLGRRAHVGKIVIAID